ncbi:MAG TPA: HNH endonuclease [Tepidisphaeraceae bacterium]|nr:HNH endonuclease [Tepidisphaeraceae bacterium]
MSHGHAHHGQPAHHARAAASGAAGHGPGAAAAAVAIPASLGHNVLVLNKFYQAIRVINVRRAFTLLCKEMAEVVHIETDAQGQSRWQNFNFADWTELSQLKKEFEPDEFDWIHTVRFQIAVPRIIRLLGYEKLPRQDVKFNRRNIYARDGNKCQYCNKRMPTTELSLDHVVPKSQGGKSTWENIVCCCVKCNVKKGGRTPEQAHMHLKTKPVKPKRSPVINIRLADERYWSWKQFLDNAYWSVELK